MNVLVGSDASPHNNRDTNGSYRCPREKIQTHELKSVAASVCSLHQIHTLCHHDLLPPYMIGL